MKKLKMKHFLPYKVRKIIIFYSFFRNKKFKYVIILLSIIYFLEIINSLSSQKDIKVNNHYIFTFWEPHNSLPGIIKLCIRTWKKFLPKDYIIIILDYHNLKNYLSLKIINKILCKKMTLPIQADAIRVAILQKYGGFWMDCDTIITNSDFINMFNNSDLFLFGNSKDNKANIGFIYAKNNSTILKTWLDRIIIRTRIYKYRLFLKAIFPIKYFIINFNKLLTWDYLGNGILNQIIKNSSKNSIRIIERKDAYVFPEIFINNGSPYKSFQDFYFTERNPESLLKKCKGILMLHNSWIPAKYKNMSEEEFLHQDILLSHLLSKLLNDSSEIKYEKNQL